MSKLKFSPSDSKLFESNNSVKENEKKSNITVSDNTLNTSKVKQNTRVRNKDSYKEQYVDKLNYNSESFVGNISNNSFNNSQIGTNKKIMNFSHSNADLRSLRDENKNQLNFKTNEESAKDINRPATSLGYRINPESNNLDYSKLFKSTGSLSLSPHNQSQDLNKPNENVDDSVNFASNNFDIIDNDNEIENVIKNAPKEKQNTVAFVSNSSEFVKKFTFSPDLNNLEENIQTNQDENKPKNLTTTFTNKINLNKKNITNASSGYAAIHNSRKNSVTAVNSLNIALAKKLINAPQYASNPAKKKSINTSTTESTEKEKFHNAVKSKNKNANASRNISQNISNNKSIDNSLNNSQLNSSRQITKTSTLLTNLKSNLLNKLEQSVNENLNDENVVKSKMKMKTQPVKNILINIDDENINLEKVVSLDLFNKEDFVINHNENLIETNNFKSGKQILKGDDEVKLEGKKTAININNDTARIVSEINLDNDNDTGTAKKIIRVKTVKKKEIIQNENENINNNNLDAINDLSPIKQNQNEENLITPDKNEINNLNHNNSIDFDTINKENLESLSKTPLSKNSNSQDENDHDNFNNQYRIDTQLSQIDEVLSNCSNFKNTDFIFHKESYHETLKIVNSNHLEFSAIKTKHQELIENLENSICIEGINKILEKDKSLYVNKINEMSIDSIYPNRLNFTENSFRMSKSELNYETKTRKISYREFISEKLEMSYDSKPRPKKFEENEFKTFKKEIVITPGIRQFNKERLSEHNQIQNQLLILPVNNKRSFRNSQLNINQNEISISSNDHIKKFKDNQLFLEKNQINIRSQNNSKKFNNNILKITKDEVLIKNEEKIKNEFVIEKLEVCIKPVIIIKNKLKKNSLNVLHSSQSLSPRRKSEIGNDSENFNKSKSVEFSVTHSFFNRKFKMQNSIINNLKQINKNKNESNKTIPKSNAISEEEKKQKLDEYIKDKIKHSVRIVSHSDFQILVSKEKGLVNMIENLNDLNIPQSQINKIYSKLEINHQNPVNVELVSNANLISKNKLKKLKENVNQPMNPETKESKFKQKVDQVKNKLIFSKKEENLHSNHNLISQKPLEDFESELKYVRPQQEYKKLEDFDNFVITDEILSEFKEKYFSAMEFLDKEMLINFYKKYMNREFIKHNLVTSGNCETFANMNSIENLKINEKDLKDLRRREDIEKEKQNERLKKILEIPDKKYGLGNINNYKSLNNILGLSKSQVSIKDKSIEKSRRLPAVNNSELFGIMPSNEVDGSSNISNMNIMTIKSNLFR